MTSSSSSSSTSLPSWMTDEAITVDALLAEIARQAPPTGLSSDPPSLFSPSKHTVPTTDPDHPDNSNYDDDADHDDAEALVANSAIFPLTKLIRNPAVLRRFLHKFVIARSGRIESAAERVLKFAKLLDEFPHLTTNCDSDVLHALGLGWIECFPLRQCERLGGAVNCFVRYRDFNWDKVTPEQMQKAAFWVLFLMMMMPNHAAQIHGVAFQLDMENCGPSNVKLQFEMFGMQLMAQCLPLRVKIFTAFNAPRFVRWLMFAPLKLILSSKIKERIFFYDTHEEIEKHFGSGDMHYTFDGGAWRPNSLPSGGDLMFAKQWTDGKIKIFLPDEVIERLEKNDQLSDARYSSPAKVDSSPRKFY
jgi:hypothetical protein